jgi:hypothetical protein
MVGVLCLFCSATTERGLLFRWKADATKKRGEFSEVWPFCEQHLPEVNEWAARQFGEARDLVAENDANCEEFSKWLAWTAVNPIVSFEGYLYLFRAGDGLYKIGFTNQVGRRLKYMKVNNPVSLELVNSWLGNRADETAIHKALRCWHVRGEWYRFPQGVDPAGHLAVQVNRLRSSACR